MDQSHLSTLGIVYDQIGQLNSVIPLPTSEFSGRNSNHTGPIRAHDGCLSPETLSQSRDL